MRAGIRSADKNPRFTFYVLRFRLYASRTHSPSPSPMPMTHAIPSSRTIQTALLSLLLLLTGPSLLCAQSEDLNKTIETEKKKLERMRKDQEQYVARVEALKEKGGRISTEMDQLDREVHATQRALRKIQAKEKRLKKRPRASRTKVEFRESCLRNYGKAGKASLIEWEAFKTG